MQIDMLLRTKRRSISIQISPEGNLIVRIPINCSYEKIEKILKEKEGWITLHQQRIKENRAVNSQIISYEKILYLGYTHNLAFTDRIKTAQFYEGNCWIPIKFQSDKQKQIKVIAKCLQLKAQGIFRNRVAYFANLMQLKPNSVTLSNSHRVWGSCDKFSNIKLNWRLVMLPPDIIDYVIVHELSHILEFNHSKIFWKVVESILADYKTRRNLLKTGDYLLELYR